MTAYTKVTMPCCLGEQGAKPRPVWSWALLNPKKAAEGRIGHGCPGWALNLHRLIYHTLSWKKVKLIKLKPWKDVWGIVGLSKADLVS